METSQSRKSFERIHEDYAFFLEHSTEPALCRAAMLAAIRKNFPPNRPVRMLDFGCGGGEFLERLLKDWDHPKTGLELELIEVDAGYLEAARKRVEAFSARPPVASSVAEGPENSLDLITSNHVLYYVKDLPATLDLLLGRLRPDGLGLLILGGGGNQLCRLWELAFARARQEVPYYLAEDVGIALENLKIKFVPQELHSVLRFPDTQENRFKILRFLFAGKLKEFSADELSELMQEWSSQGEIVMENVDVCYALEPGNQTIR